MSQTQASPSLAPGEVQSRREPLSALTVRPKLLSAGPIIILLVLIVVLSIVSPPFLTTRNLSNILVQTAVIAVVAMGAPRDPDPRHRSFGGLQPGVSDGGRRVRVAGQGVRHTYHSCHTGERGTGGGDQWLRLCIWAAAASVRDHAGSGHSE